MQPAVRTTAVFLGALALAISGSLASGTGRSLTQLVGSNNALVDQASNLVGQVAGATATPGSDAWNTYSAQGPAAPVASSYANKLEAVVASGLPSAIAQAYGPNGGTLSTDKVLQFLQGAVAEEAELSSSDLAPSAALPAATLNAAAQQVAAILVASTVDNGLSTETISDEDDPNFAGSQLQDVYASAASDVSEGLEEATDNSPTSSVPTGQVAQSLLRAGLVQPSYAGAAAIGSTESEQVLEAKAIQFGLQQLAAANAANPAATAGPSSPSSGR